LGSKVKKDRYVIVGFATPSLLFGLIIYIDRVVLYIDGFIIRNSANEIQMRLCFHIIMWLSMISFWMQCGTNIIRDIIY